MFTENAPGNNPIEIIGFIEKSIQNDKGIVPLIGAGMSAPSGIPAGNDYFAYLFYCLTRVLGTSKKGHQQQWDPSTLRWPDFSEMPVFNNFTQEKIDWCSFMDKKVEKQNKINNEIIWNKKNKIDEDRQVDNEIIEIYLQAIGVVSDWRATLNLLSRLALDGDSNESHKKVILKQPDERIIDSFFVNLTKGKKPNSAHMLLAHMADILRIKIILTTNFDSLIEDAFQQLVNPIAVFDVHLDARLPDADFVRAQRSVVKMHGGRYGLRADFSLDKDPTKDDVEQFVNYLSFYKCKDNRPKLQCQRNLLVMGVSPYAKRVLELICHAMVKLQNLQIFWICYDIKDIDNVWNKFDDTFKELSKKGTIDATFYTNFNIEKINKNSKQLIVNAATDLTSFMLELYQSVFLSLPPAGVQFSSVWPFPAKPCVIQINEYQTYVDEIIQEIEKKSLDEQILYICGENGISAMASDIFYQITSRYCCLWFNLEQTFYELDFTYSLIEAIAKKVGYFGLIPAQFSSSQPEIPESVINQYNRIIKYAKKRIVVFINYREIPSPYVENIYNENTNKLIKLLKRVDNKNVIYIVLGHHTHPEMDLEINSDQVRIIDVVNPVAQKFDPETIFKNEILTRETDNDLSRFLLSLSLVRNITYLSLLHTWSFIKAPYSLICGDSEKDNDKVRYDLAKQFLVTINEHKLFRSDDNHFVYVPYVNREKIQDKIKSLYSEKHEDYAFIKAESHQGIADWYLKLYRSSNDIHAMTESIHHRFECFKSALEINSISDSLIENQERFLTTSLIEMDQTIKLSGDTIYTSFQTLAIKNALSIFSDDLSDFADMIGKEYTQIDHIEWYSYKLKEIKSNILKICDKFLKKTGNISNEDSYPSLSLNIINKEFLQSRINKEYKEILSKVISNIHKRQYVAAKSGIITIYEDLKWYGFKDFTDAELLKNDTQVINKELTEKIRKKVRDWIKAIIEKNNQGATYTSKNPGRNYEYALIYAQNKIKFMIKVFRYHHHLNLFEAQIHRYLDEIIPDEFHKVENRKKLQKAEIIYICSTEMMRYVMDNEFINHENATLRTNTGIMLSWMQRHHEAYRRYNESYGYLNFGVRPDTPLEFALIDLRRGETFISKIEQRLYEKEIPVKDDEIGGLPPGLKAYFGYLYDAIASIDRGESRMKGYSIDIWWHCWMLELQLNLCTKIKKLRKEVCEKLGYDKGDKYDLFGHCRECEFCGNRFIKNLEKGLEIVGSDALRIARYLDLLKSFKYDIGNKNLSDRYKTAQKNGIKLLNVLIKQHEDSTVPIDNRIYEYAKNVQGKFIHKLKI